MEVVDGEMLLLPPVHVQVDCHEVGRIVFFSKHLIKTKMNIYLMILIVIISLDDNRICDNISGLLPVRHCMLVGLADSHATERLNFMFN